MTEISLNEQFTNATLSWRVFDDITYKKIETALITDFSTQFRDPSNPTKPPRPLIALARCGGPLASIYKSPKATTSNENRYVILIQNAPQVLRKTREFDRGVIIFADFTIKEDLLLVTEDGKYHLIDIFHSNTSNDKTITLSESVSTISSASTFKSIQGTGLVAFRKNQEGFVAVKNVYNPVIQMISLGMDVRSAVTAWCVLDPTDMTLLYAYDNVVATTSASSTRREQQTIPGMIHVILKLVASDNYKSIAMLRDNGDILIAMRELIGQSQSFVLKYASPSDKPKISDIAWCGSDAVIAIRPSLDTWYDLLIINGRNSAPMSEQSQLDITSETLCYTSPVSLFTEIDGVRIVSGRHFDFFQRLPSELYSVCSLMSESPGARLFSAYLNYQYGNQTSELLLKQLKSSSPNNDLEQAVKQCIFAASYENDPFLQKNLLKAALFGRSFLGVSLSNSSSTNRPSVKMINELCTTVIRQLHLVNNLQHISISIPLTYQQFELIGTEMLIDRLLRRNLHDFATSVTKSLHIPPEKGENRILVQWAVQQINSSGTTEEAIAKQIKDRLANVPGIPFIDIAREAFKAKKYVLVERLLDVKVSLSDQIDMLLQLQKNEEALQKAISCGDTDLVLYVLMRTKPAGSPHEYIIKLSKMKSLPLNLLLQSLEERERMSLHNDMIKHNPEERERIAYSHIVQRFSGALTIADQRTELNSAAKLFREMKNETHAQLVDEEARLISKQDDLEKKLINVQLKGLSLVDTMETLLIYNEREADLLKKEFNMPDKRYYWIKIQGYAKRQAWAQLMEFGRKGSSPIGYEPFLDVCLKYNKSDEARRYVDRTVYSSKLDDERLPYMFAKVQMIDEAIAAAIKLKSPEALDFIEAKCQSNETNQTKVRQARERVQDPGKGWLLGGFLKS